jgi:site-specific DNA-methyltransferase (adenine-specific)
MDEIQDGVVDLVLTDPPYGTTRCKWDEVIPFEPMWESLRRVTKQDGAIVLFGGEPFSSKVRASNLQEYKYDWVWVKENGTGFLNAKKQPLRVHEDIMVFYRRQCTYNPQMRTGFTPYKTTSSSKTDNYGDYDRVETVSSGERYPINALYFGRDKDKYHPTQKPVALLEYLIKTYTNEGDLVLDFTMGSGSTGVACRNTGRRFIGIEKDEKYFNIERERIG